MQWPQADQSTLKVIYAFADSFNSGLIAVSSQSIGNSSAELYRLPAVGQVSQAIGSLFTDWVSKLISNSISKGTCT